MNGETTQKNAQKKNEKKVHQSSMTICIETNIQRIAFYIYIQKDIVNAHCRLHWFFFRLLLRLGDKIDETRRIACIHSNNFFHSFTPIKYSTAANYEFEISRSQAIGGENRSSLSNVSFILSVAVSIWRVWMLREE